MDSSRRTLLALFLMLGAMWFWKSRTEEAAESPLAYSQLFAWAQQGKIESVVISGDVVDGTLKKAESLDGKAVQTFHCDLPQNDPALLSVLREKGAKIVVKSQKQPFAVHLVLTLLPWALIIGASFWMSRRARGMLGAGGPFGGLMKGPGRKFDKATSVNVTFDDIAGLKSAKEDLLEIVEFLKEPERFRRLGGKVPRGVLLVGPPGTGGADSVVVLDEGEPFDPRSWRAQHTLLRDGCHGPDVLVLLLPDVGQLPDRDAVLDEEAIGQL